LITNECGKTYDEAYGEVKRGIENVEVACGAPILMQGHNNEDISRGIDEHMYRQPLGVVAAITPFNFPAMIPLWFLPYAIASGNTFILKPSERVPLTARLLIDLLHQTGIPKGVVGKVVGAKPAVDALLHHSQVRAISFVGSTPVAVCLSAGVSAQGRWTRCPVGATNWSVVMPGAGGEMSGRIIAGSAFGCSGHRCLAISAAITVGDAHKTFNEAVLDIASAMK